LKNQPKYALLFGANLSGKTTQGSELASRIGKGALHSDMSAIIKNRMNHDRKFREEFMEMMAAGDLLPCNVTSSLFMGHAHKIIHLWHVLTGFPRTLVQGISFNQYMVNRYGLNSYLTNVIVIEIIITLEVALLRAASRRQKAIDKGEEPRPDDDPEVVTHRFERYKQESEPLMHYYREIGMTIHQTGLNATQSSVSSQIWDFVKAF